MADVAENKPTEQAAEQQPEATTNGAASTESGEKPTDANTNEVKNEPAQEQDNERKRRGSFERGGDFKRGRGNFRGKTDKKIMSRFESMPESNDAGEIRRQVEFYFSDSNLPMDAYLLKLSGGKENKPVPLKTIHDFKRMKHFQPYSAVRDAVAASKVLNLDDNDGITRKTPLADKFGDDAIENKQLANTAAMARSIYAKGFGSEDERTQLAIEEYFEPYGPVKAVRLRRADDGTFKGSVFTEFESEDAAKAFLELDPKPTFNDRDLNIMGKQAYIDQKNEDIKAGRIKPHSPTRYGGRNDNWKPRGGRGGGRGRGGARGGRGRGGSRGRGGRDGGYSGDRNAEREQREANAGAENKKRSRDDAEGEAQQPEPKKAKEDSEA